MSGTNVFHHVAEHGYKRLINGFNSLPVTSSNTDDTGKTLASGFVHFKVDFSSTNFSTINGYYPRVKALGFYEIKIFTLQNTGMGQGLIYADTLADLFRGKMFEGIETLDPTVLSAEQIENSKGQFWLTVLIIPFRYDINVSTI